MPRFAKAHATSERGCKPEHRKGSKALGDRNTKLAYCPKEGDEKLSCLRGEEREIKRRAGCRVELVFGEDDDLRQK